MRKILGYKPTKEICISITCDASQAIETIESVKSEMLKLRDLQKSVDLNLSSKKTE